MHTRIQGRLGAQSPPPRPPPTPTKSHSYTPKVQTIFFTLMLSRATKAIKWSISGLARYPLSPHQLKGHEI